MTVNYEKWGWKDICQDEKCDFKIPPRYHSHNFTFGKDKKNCPKCHGKWEIIAQTSETQFGQNKERLYNTYICENKDCKHKGYEDLYKDQDKWLLTG